MTDPALSPLPLLAEERRLADDGSREGRLCLALALWNGKDPYLKEHLFGLTNGEGNHGEDVTEADLLLFHEYFDGNTGRGLGAGHQTGWTALVVRLLGSC